MPDEMPPVTPGSPVRDLWPLEWGGYAGRMGTVARRCLRKGGIGTVGELTGKDARDIGDIRGAGDGVVAEVRRVLAVHGLCLKDDGTEAAMLPARARLLSHAGLRRSAALRFARESWPSGEIAPGVVLTVTGGDGHG